LPDAIERPSEWVDGFEVALEGRPCGVPEQRDQDELELERALAEARRFDLALRNAVARAIAHRTELELLLERAVEDAARARADAIDALRREDAAGEPETATRARRAAESAALRLGPAERLVEALKSQYATAVGQVEQARAQVDEHAMQVERVSARRAELLGQLAGARVQEELARTLRNVGEPMDTSGPTLDELEDRIRERTALAQAEVEVEAGSPSAAIRDLEASSGTQAARARLAALRREVGLDAGAR
jgi:phage shock protein A